MFPPLFPLHFTFNPRSYLLTLLVSPTALALEMAILYISMRSKRHDSSPVAPLAAAGGAECDAAVTLGAGRATAGGVGEGVSSLSSSKTSFSSAYIEICRHLCSLGKIQIFKAT